MQWDVRVPLRDGAHLSATLYRAWYQIEPAPTLFVLTPYVGQSLHDVGVYFAARGYPFLTVDVRGRGNSDGTFGANGNEGRDGYDVVEWLATQPYCDGAVAMWGGSYAGLVQWNTASERPPHLRAIAPVASPFRGVDSPAPGNIFLPYRIQWLTLIAGRGSQEKIFADQVFWNQQFQRWFEAGVPFRELDTFLGVPSETFQEWLSHPERDAYWDRYNPVVEQYAQISLPILTITGTYDANQLGAIEHHRQHLAQCSAEARARHSLVIGPWDHAGTRTPKPEFGGLRVGPAALVDMLDLHRQWYDWTLRNGAKPAFLRKNIAYYVMGEERWRYADSLEEITAKMEVLRLHSRANPTDVFRAGDLLAEGLSESGPDEYLHDPRDMSLAALESRLDPASLVEQSLIRASAGKQLVYHSAPFTQARELSGFFRLTLWISIDQPDTDFRASIFQVRAAGDSVVLVTDVMRARYRESLREARLVRTTEPLEYHFARFPFVSRRIEVGSWLRLVVGPVHSIHCEKNYNTGGVVAEESMREARPVRVRLFHDAARPSALYVPFGRPDTDDNPDV